jgi:hypothetical protein
MSVYSLPQWVFLGPTGSTTHPIGLKLRPKWGCALVATGTTMHTRGRP